MSLSIDIDNITAVLIAGHWHKVLGKSFEIDAFEFTQGEALVLGGGSCEQVAATGFSFKTAGGTWMAGPLTSIQAVRFR